MRMVVRKSNSRVDRRGLDQLAIRNISGVLPSAYIVEDIAQIIPEAKSLNFPRVSVEMPDSTLFQDRIEESFP